MSSVDVLRDDFYTNLATVNVVQIMVFFKMKLKAYDEDNDDWSYIL